MIFCDFSYEFPMSSVMFPMSPMSSSMVPESPLNGPGSGRGGLDIIHNNTESGGQRGWDLGFPALHRHHSGTGRKDTQNGKRCRNYHWP